MPLIYISQIFYLTTIQKAASWLSKANRQSTRVPCNNPLQADYSRVHVTVGDGLCSAVGGSHSSCCPWSTSLPTRLARWRADGAGPVRICSFLAFFSCRRRARRVLALVPLLPALCVPGRATPATVDRLAHLLPGRLGLGCLARAWRVLVDYVQPRSDLVPVRSLAVLGRLAGLPHEPLELARLRHRPRGPTAHLLRCCSGALPLRTVPSAATAGAAQNAVGPQVVGKPVGAVGRYLGHRAQQSRVAAHRVRVLSSARRLEVLDLNKDTVLEFV
eukprot:COSAG03_NODE_1020_length_5006_cov_51.395965_2_plen_274_part_00